MKKEELIALGISEEVAAKVMAINGADIEHAKAAKDKERKSVEDERDGYKTRAEAAEETLKSFDGIDPATVKQEVANWQAKATQLEKDYTEKITQRDQRDWLKEKFDSYGIASPFARSALQSECMAKETGLKWKDGAFLGFDDFMKSAKEKDSNLYKTAEEKTEEADAEAARRKAPNFTGPTGKDRGDGEKKFTVPYVF